jgi:hypothetical protein
MDSADGDPANILRWPIHPNQIILQLTKFRHRQLLVSAPTQAFWKIIAPAALALACVTPAMARGGGHGGSHGGGHSSVRSSRALTGDHLVSGYVRSDGTYVHSYHATNPNGTRNDNYSTRGNVNPYTGQEGTKPRDGETPQ